MQEHPHLQKKNKDFPDRQNRVRQLTVNRGASSAVRASESGGADVSYTLVRNIKYFRYWELPSHRLTAGNGLENGRWELGMFWRVSTVGICWLRGAEGPNMSGCGCEIFVFVFAGVKEIVRSWYLHSEFIVFRVKVMLKLKSI